MPDIPEIPEACVVGLLSRDGAPAPVVLTYDDGPEPGGTNRVLVELDRARATATFFVLLTRVRLHPGLLAETVQAGHEIALHGFDHERATTKDTTLFSRQLHEAKDDLENLIQKTVRWYRPPYGALSHETWSEVLGLGLTPVLWSLHVSDWLPVSTARRLRDLRTATNSGHIVLAHDGHATLVDGADDGPSLDLDRGHLARQILKVCEQKWWRPTSLGDALDAGHVPCFGSWFATTPATRPPAQH